MVYLRRSVWFIARNLIWICVILGILVAGFYMCLNTANIYVILTDGLEKRVDAILTRQDAERLGMYFHADFLSNDDALEGAFDGTSVYTAYNITGYDYDLKIEKLWAWPWDQYATCTVVERVSNIKGNVKSDAQGASTTIPSWQGGRYDITVVRQDGQWKINGMQQTAVLMEAATGDAA